MTDHTTPNWDRITGAKAALNEAVRLLNEALTFGPSPRAASNVHDAEKLAAGATVLVESITDKEHW